MKQSGRLNPSDETGTGYHATSKYGRTSPCVACINGRRYVCCSECYAVSIECDKLTYCLVQPIGAHGGEVMYCGCFCFRGELGFLDCDGISMCVVNMHVSPSGLFLIPFMLT